MSTLTGNTIASTYQSLLKTADNGTIDSTSKNITDGGGNASALSLSTQDVTINGTLIVSGGLTIANGVTADITASYAVSASYAPGLDPVIGVSGSTIYSIQPGISNFNTVDSILIGDNAGTDAPDANSSIFIGASAGLNATAADNSVFIGNQAGQDATDSDVSVFIGVQAGQDATNADNSVFIGLGAGQAALTANNSVFIGNAAGQSATNAAYSTLIGFQAGLLGAGITGIGSNNIIIGTNITLPDDATNTANVGGVLFISGTYSDVNTAPFSGSVEGARVGIGTATPAFTLDVSGSGNFSGGVVGQFARNQTAPGYSNTITSHASIFNPTSLTIQNTDLFITEENSDYYVLNDITVDGTLIVSGTIILDGVLLGSGPVIISPSGSII